MVLMAITNGAGNRVYFNYERFLRHHSKGKLNDGDIYYNKNSPNIVTVRNGDIDTTSKYPASNNTWSG